MTCKRALIDTNKLIREGAIGGLRILIIIRFGNIIDKVFDNLKLFWLKISKT